MKKVIISLGYFYNLLQVGYKAFEAAEIAGNPYHSSKNAMAVMYSTYSALFGSTSVVFAKVEGSPIDLLSGYENPGITCSITLPSFY